MKTQETKTNLPVFTVLERAVLYARVSGNDRSKEGRNLTGQLEMGREYAQAKGYNIVAELAEDDRGASGYEIDLPQLNLVREMAHARQFDVLVVRELDRLSRNLAKQLIVEEELKRAGVRVEYVLGEYDDTPEGRLQKHIRATIAEFEREKIKERMVRGKRNKVKAGKVLPSRHRPYGYKFANDNLEIYEPEAQIVRLIFQLYVVENLGVITIAKKLTKMQVPTYLMTNPTLSSPTARKYSNRWAEGSIRGILRNKTYIGQWVYGKRKRVGGKGATVYNPSDYLLTVAVPPIVTPEIFKAAQDKLNEARKMSKRNTKHKYLMARRLTCECGHAIVSMTFKQERNKKLYQYAYYHCNAALDKFGYPDLDCPGKYFSTKIVDNMVWEWLEELIQDPDKLEKGLRDYQNERANAVSPFQQNLVIIESLIERHTADLNDALANLKLVKGERAKAVIANDIQQAEQALDSLERQRKELIKQIERDALTDEQINEIKAFAAQLGEDWEIISQDFESRRAFVDKLDVRGTLKMEGDQKVLYVSAKIGNGPTRLLLTDYDKNQYNAN